MKTFDIFKVVAFCSASLIIGGIAMGLEREAVEARRSTEIRQQPFDHRLEDGNVLWLSTVVPPEQFAYDGIRVRFDCIDGKLEKLGAPFTTKIRILELSVTAPGGSRCAGPTCWEVREVPVTCGQWMEHVDVDLKPFLGHIYPQGVGVRLKIGPPDDLFVEWRGGQYRYEYRLPEPVPGPQGATGATGPAGPASVGPPGAQGKPGRDGKDGKPGVCQCKDPKHKH